MLIKITQLLLKLSGKAYLAAIGGKDRIDILAHMEGDQVIPMVSAIVDTVLAGVKDGERQQAGEMLAAAIQEVVNKKEDAE